MSDRFLVLANSSKGISKNSSGDTGRCVAGIQIKDNGDLCWLRPVDSSTETGAIPKDIASKYNVFSVIDIESINDDPNKQAYQCENKIVTFGCTNNKIKKIDFLKILERIQQDAGDSILGINGGKTYGGNSISESLKGGLNGSIGLVAPKYINFYIKLKNKDGKEKKQIKCKFSFNGNSFWDIPVTDPIFFEKYVNNLDYINNLQKQIYLVVSLGLPYKRENEIGKSIYLLAACVFFIDDKNFESDDTNKYDNNNIKEYLATKLNEEQCKAALHTETSSLILAGAGSGKTRTLTYKIAYLMFGLGIKPSNILAVTFTNKAANELKERLIDLAKEFSQLDLGVDKKVNSNDIQGDSIDDFLAFVESTAEKKSSVTYGVNDFKRIGTFHSIFLKILKEDIEGLEMKYDKTFSIIDADDSAKVIKDLLKKYNLEDVLKPNEVKGFISNEKNNGFDAKMFESKVVSQYDMNMGKIYTEYQKELERSNMLDFDDLLLLPYLLFKKKPEILEKWKRKFLYIMVDEAQDTNWIQFELMKMLSGEDGNITMIGDDYQSIYGRRGALMENFLNVKKYRPDMQMFKLQINYRSRPYIVEAGNAVIKKNLKQYDKTVRSFREENGKITIFGNNTEMDEAANLIDLISKMKNSGKIQSRGDVAILYRTNAQSSPFEQVLVQEGIPYKIWGAFKFFDRKEVKDILAYMKYLANPNDSISLKRIINLPGRLIGKTTLDKLEDYAAMNGYSLNEVIENIDSVPEKVTPQAKNGILEFKQVIHEITDNRDQYSPADAMEKIVKGIKYRAYLVKEHGSEEIADEKYENIGQLINLASKYVEKGQDAVRQFMEEITLLTDVAADDDGNLDAIKLMTAHSSKGLEFPVVFIAGLEDNIFPLTNAMMEPNLLEEERRLMYVAITRAKDHLFLSYANSRMTWGQTRSNPESRFIAEIPLELVKRYDLGSGSVGEGNQQEEHYDISEGHVVNHKLFGNGYVLEVWNNLAIVKFYNPKFGVRKIELRFLTKVE